jgi:hypothetical protein
MDYSYFKPANEEFWAFGAPLWTSHFLKDVEVASVGINKAELKNYIINKLFANIKVIKINKSILFCL